MPVFLPLLREFRQLPTLILILAGTIAGCGETVVLGYTNGDFFECVPVPCQGAGTKACGDCVDNDGDGHPDAADEHCLSACDDDESGFYVAQSGNNQASCNQDCFFDSNSGAGNDGCQWDHQCDPLSPAGDSCPYDDGRFAATCESWGTAQSDYCVSTCLSKTPNGCDCFGCCELPARSGNFVWLGKQQQNQATCNEDSFSDPESCPPCTPVPSCQNTCDSCEVCVGGSGLPPGCQANDACPDGALSCATAPFACTDGTYCVTGCCREVAP